MLTNEEFIIKLDHRHETFLDRDYKSTNEMNHSKVREQKQEILKSIIKKRTKIIVPVDVENRFYRSKYTTICTNEIIKARSRKFKDYYCTNDITIETLKEQEFEQMLKHYKAYLKASRKGFVMFIRNYVIVDESLLYKLIDHVSNTPQQAYKKRIQWKRYKEEKSISGLHIFKELEFVSTKEKEYIKQMYEYNKSIKKI